jgi:flagellar biosynthesis protein FliQ
MKRLIEIGKEGFSFWKLAIFKCVLSALIQGIMAFLVAVQTIDWETTTTFVKVCILLGAFAVACKDVLSFLSTTMEGMNKKKDEATEKKNIETASP